MSNTTVSLERIINRSFDGKQRTLASTTGLTPGMISKLVSGIQPLTHNTLNKICNHLDPTDARHLALAACRDLLPADLAQELTLNENESLLCEPTPAFNELDPDTETIFAKLRALVLKDPESREWLHHLARWIFPE